MKNKIINYGLTAVAFLSTALSMPYLPDRVPMHFDVNGAVDRYGSKYEMFILPLAMLIMNIALEFVARKNKNAALNTREAQSARANAKVSAISATAISVVFWALNFGLLYLAFLGSDSVESMPFDMMGIISTLLGLAIIVMGNYMPKTKANSLIGFRCKWTKYNEVTWQKSNRFGAYVMIVSGIASTLCGLIFGGMTSVIILLSVVIMATVVTLIYAYFIYKKESGNDKAEK